MKFIHTSDWHLGKTVHEFSMIEDQKHMLSQIIEIAIREKVEVILIAGDIYDRPIPPVEAIKLFDDFLSQMQENNIKVIAISGNHDSGDRLSFGTKILEKQNIYLIGGNMQQPREILLEDAFGTVAFVCIPFLKPSIVETTNSYDCVKKLLEQQVVNEHRKVCITHFFVTGENGENPILSDSESTVNVGGLDNVNANLFREFHYTALGHIHKSQKVGAQHVYYSGAPMKYSFGEAKHEKSINIVELDALGQVSLHQEILLPKHDMRIMRGELEQLMNVALLNEEEKYDYIQAVLLDENELIDPMNKLRILYPNMMQVLLEKKGRNSEQIYELEMDLHQLGTKQLFMQFYEMLKGYPMEEEKRKIVENIIEKIEL